MSKKSVLRWNERFQFQWDLYFRHKKINALLQSGDFIALAQQCPPLGINKYCLLLQKFWFLTNAKEKFPPLFAARFRSWTAFGNGFQNPFACFTIRVNIGTFPGSSTQNRSCHQQLALLCPVPTAYSGCGGAVAVRGKHWWRERGKAGPNNDSRQMRVAGQ